MIVFGQIVLSILLFITLFVIFKKIRTPLYERQLKTLLNSLAKRNKSHVFALIDSPCQDSSSSIYDHINSTSAIQLLEAIRRVPCSETIELILHTEGGEIGPALQIARALSQHKGSVLIYVPFYAYSAGTMLCLSARHIFLDQHAVLGPIDPQILVGRSASAAPDLNQLVERKNIDTIKDGTLLAQLVGTKWMELGAKTIGSIMGAHYPVDVIDKVREELATGKLPHDAPLHIEELHRLGLHISAGCLAPEIYAVVTCVVERTCALQRRTIFQSA